MLKGCPANKLGAGGLKRQALRRRAVSVKLEFSSIRLKP